MHKRSGIAVGTAALAVGVSAAALIATSSCGRIPEGLSASAPQPLCVSFDPVVEGAIQTIIEGRETFRFETFGDEQFWGAELRLHQAIAGAELGGVGGGLSPRAALALGLKVDVNALPEQVIEGLAGGMVNLDDPATTLTLLKLNAVVGLTGFFRPNGELESIGIQCALCHSTVDDSLLTGVGARLDGWPNRDLDVGAIIALAPNLEPIASLLGVDEDTVRAVLSSWGPGKFDAELLLDGIAFRPDGKSAATLIPAAFGLAGVNLHTYTGWGSVTHWNALVANIEMQGSGVFFDPRLKNPDKFPIATAAGFYDIRNHPDLITPKLAALHLFQLALKAPSPPPESFDAGAAARGGAVFRGVAQCNRCHVPPLFTEPGWNMHTAEEIGIDDFQAKRSPDERYRTTPLKGLFTRKKGGFYHDGRFATLADVVEHYDDVFRLGLTNGQKSDLVQYLESL